MTGAPLTWTAVETGLTGLTYGTAPPVPTAWYSMACGATVCVVGGTNNAAPYYPAGAYGS